MLMGLKVKKKSQLIKGIINELGNKKIGFNKPKCLLKNRALLEHVEAAHSTFVDNFPKYRPKYLVSIVWTIVMFILDFLKGYDVANQQVIMHKVVSHEILINVMSPYLQDVKRLKHNHQLLENFKSRLSSHVTNQRSYELVMVKDMMCNFASFQSIANSKETTNVLGVDKIKNIKKASKKQLLLDTSSFISRHITKGLNIQILCLNIFNNL